jgi:hypothetical protein
MLGDFGSIFVAFDSHFLSHMSVEAFSRLKQRVIWKWETESMEGKPDNVFLSKWLPQQVPLLRTSILSGKRPGYIFILKFLDKIPPKTLH